MPYIKVIVDSQIDQSSICSIEFLFHISIGSGDA